MIPKLHSVSNISIPVINFCLFKQPITMFQSMGQYFQCLRVGLFRVCLCFWCHCLTLIKQSLSAPVQLKGSVGCGYLGCCWGLTTPFFYPPHPLSPSFHQFLMLFNNNDQNMPNSGTVQYCILFTLGIFLHQSWNISGQIVGSTSLFIIISMGPLNSDCLLNAPHP